MGRSESSRESAAAGSSSEADVAVEARLPVNSDTPTSEGVGGSSKNESNINENPDKINQKDSPAAYPTEPEVKRSPKSKTEMLQNRPGEPKLTQFKR